MSSITDVILIVSPGESVAAGELPPQIQEINKYLQAEYESQLEQVNEYAGGNKVFSSFVFLGSFNSFSSLEFLSLVANQKWYVPARYLGNSGPHWQRVESA